MYSGAVKVQIGQRLGNSWGDLADWLEIPQSDRAQFRPGYEPQEIWEWLELRERLSELRPALLAIERDDLAWLLQPDESEQWRQVLTLPTDGTQPDGFFAGRENALNHIMDWLTRPRSKPVCIVTGDPGSGKSAVLAWFALRGRRPDPVGARITEPPTEPIVAAVDARGLAAEDVLKRLADQVGSAAASFRELWDTLATRPGPAGVVLDSVDESSDPGRLLRQAQTALRSGTHPRVRLLIGVRRPLTPRHPTATVDLVDLDEEFADPAAVLACASRILRRHPTFQVSETRVNRVAAAIADAANRSFLVAGLSAAALVERGVLPEPETRFPQEVGEAMQGYLDAVRVDRRQTEDLLRPLAYAKGLGLPMDQWIQLAGELAGAPGGYTRDNIRELLTGPVAAFVVVARTQPTDEAGSRAAYRLFHEALDEHLHALEPAFPEAPRPGAEARETIALVLWPARWDHMADYVRDHLADHAVGTTVLTQLIHSSAFLVRADPASVLRALPRIVEGDLTAAQAYESVVHHLHAGVSTEERYAYLVLAAHRVADTALAVEWERDAPRASWWPLAALWRRTARSRIIRRHEGAVVCVAAARPLGENVVASTDSAGAVAISGVADSIGKSPDPIVVSDQPIEAAAVAVIDGLPLLVVGDEGGALHTIDLPGTAVDPLGPADGAGVSALAWDTSSSDQVVLGRRDGTLATRTLFRSVEPAAGRAGTAEVFALAPIGQQRFLGATGDGRLFLWDIPGEAITPVGEALPRTTALAAAEDAVVTGHDDGSVRYWPAETGRLGEPLALGPDQVRPPQRRTGEAPAVVAVGAARPSGRLVVLAADEEDEIAVVDVATGRCWEDGLSGHEGPVWALATFTAGDRTIVAAGGEDETVRLWQLDDLAVPAAGRTFLARPWSPMRLIEHRDRLPALPGHRWHRRLRGSGRADRRDGRRSAPHFRRSGPDRGLLRDAVR
ncbi:AAA family ATPase [Actinoplanes sp. NPDC089786]|uniref:AAA family ATPase n=1 Tax=Actinoplanes sp. NPDC089786 TaxID=3155185 RepID=UPI0034202DEB